MVAILRDRALDRFNGRVEVIDVNPRKFTSRQISFWLSFRIPECDLKIGSRELLRVCPVRNEMASKEVLLGRLA